MRFNRRWWAGLIYWGVVLASVVVTVDTVGKVIRDERSLRGLELSKVTLDNPLRAGEPFYGRAMLFNHTGSTIWMERAGNTHFWFDWTASTPVHIMPDMEGGFRPCGTDGPSNDSVEVAPGPVWWCFRQTSPTLGGKELGQLRTSRDSRLWFASFVTYRNSEGKIRHARLCRVYNFEAERFERSRGESCDWFD
jgi:hypothetical protein